MVKKILIPIAIAVAVVIVIAVVASLFFIPGPTEAPTEGTTEESTEAPTEGGVPLYGGSTEYSPLPFLGQIIGIPQEGVTVSVYYSSEASVEDILNWYKDALKDWEIVGEIAIVSITTPQGSVEYGGIIFKKGNEGIGIFAVSGQSVEGGVGTAYYIIKGPLEEFGVEEGEELPSTDQASGEEPIERYPNSVMLSHYTEENYYNIGYGTRDSVENVFNWYEQYLISEGWTIISESQTESEWNIKAEKGDLNVEIRIYPPEEFIKYTEIYVYYWITPAPTPVEPTSDLGIDVNAFIKSVLQAASNQEVILINYVEVSVGMQAQISMRYALQTEIEDHSSIAQAIKNELISRGIAEESIIMTVDEDSAEIFVTGGELAGKPLIGLQIILYKDSDTIEVNVILGE